MNGHENIRPEVYALALCYESMLVNTGGNPAVKLLSDLAPYSDGRPNRLMSTNVVRFVLAVAVESQLLLIHRLIRHGLMPVPPCPSCGTWVCADCGWRRTPANRYADTQDCPKCHGTEGTMLEVRHNSYEKWLDHVGALPQNRTPLYPLKA